MNKICSVLALIIMVIFSSCEKLVDKYFPGHGHNKATCRIKEITQGSYDIEQQRTGQFHYSNKGLLDSITFDLATGSAGAQFYYFRYDKNKRLTEFRADYSRDAGDYYYIHKYAYNGNKIIRDTMFVRQAGTYTIVETLTYDNQARIIKADGVLIEADGQPQHEQLEPKVYEYNEDGNLIKEPMSEYDDRVSFLRTNFVLMFVQRNFSQNNAMTANAYNEFDLPLGFDMSPIGVFLDWGLPTSIKYQCN